jgi:hypothetical protein
MKTKILLIYLVLASILTGCTPYMYGVPQENWDRMSEAERIEAMRVYEREQTARRQAAEERARRLAMERERERERQAELAAQRAREAERERARLAALEQARLERIESIHRGGGAYGELIRVRLQGGRMRFGDRHHRYEPVGFTIADGETMVIRFADRRGREAGLTVTYANGALTIDGLRFPYERRWGRGTQYVNIGTVGPSALQGVDVLVEIRDRSTRFDRELPRLVAIREEPPVVVREQDRHEMPPATTARAREHHQPPAWQPQASATPVAQAPVPPPAQPILPQVVQNPPPQPVRQQTPPPARQQPSNQGTPSNPPPTARQREKDAGQAPRAVTVSLLAAEQKVRGRNQRVEPVTVHLVEGESRDLAVKSGGETSTITVAYRGGEVAIQGTPGKGRDGIHLPFEKEWQGGKVYRFALKGKVMLDNVELKVAGE